MKSDTYCAMLGINNRFVWKDIRSKVDRWVAREKYCIWRRDIHTDLVIDELLIG